MNSTRGGIEGKIGERCVWGVNSSSGCSLIHQSYNTKVDDFDIVQIGYCLVRVVMISGVYCVFAKSANIAVHELPNCLSHEWLIFAKRCY